MVAGVKVARPSTVTLGIWSLVLIAAVMVPAAVYGQTDTTPPVLTSLSIDPNPVDVTSGPQTVTLTMNVTDDLSGVNIVQGALQSPTTGQYLYFYAYLAAGDNLNGTWIGSVTVPQYSEAGDWSVSYISLQDTDTNTQYLYNYDLQNLGFPTTFTVISQPDTTPPQLTSFSFTPSAVNTSAADQIITFNLGLTDDLSGVNFGCGFYCYYTVYLTSPSGKQWQGLVNYYVTQVSGTPLSGVWQGQITMPRYSEPGNWQVNFMTLEDNANNFSYLYTSNLQAMGFPTTIAVTSNPSDTTPPKISSLSFGPNFIDTTMGSQPVTVTLGLSDNLSGVNYGWVYFTSPSGGQNQYAYFSSYNRIAGTATNGTYQYVFYMPQYSEAGTWQVSQIYAYDNDNNSLYLTNAQLQAMGLPTQLVVVLPSNQVDGNLDSNGGTVMDAVFGDRAEVTFPPGVLSQPTDVSIDVFTEQIQLPIPQGYTAAGTAYVNLSFNPEPNLPLPAPGMSLVLPLPNQMPPGSTLTLFKVDPKTGNLIPEPGVYSSTVIGTVNADGLSATFDGIAGLSVVVGLIPSSVIPGDVNGDGQVDCTDMSIVQASFGLRLGQAGFNSMADTNHDNVVNIIDLSYVSRHLPKGTVCKYVPLNKLRQKQMNANYVKTKSKAGKKK